MDLDKYEQMGRDLLGNYGAYKELRGYLGVTVSRMATLTGINSKTLQSWEDAGRTESMSAKNARLIGRFHEEVLTIIADLAEQDLKLTSMMPWLDVSRAFGLSPHSLRLAEKCQDGSLTCHDLGVIGIYVPRAEVEKLKKSGF